MDGPSDFQRGHTAGEIAARLAGHDKHFAAINGSLGDVATEMHDMTLAVQRLGDQAEAAARTVITTAAALKDAEEARRGRASASWTPFQRFLAALAGVGLVAATVLGIIAAYRS
jgi:hypothetical protein